MDYGDELAELLAAYLNGLADAESFNFRFRAEAPDDPYAELALDPAAKPQHFEGVKVFTVSSALTLARLDVGRGMSLGPSVELYVTRFIDDGTSRKTCGRLFRDLRDAVVGQTLGDKYRWTATEVITAYDPAILRNQQRYVAQARLTFQHFTAPVV